MAQKTEREELQAAIDLLHGKQANELAALKSQFYVTYESLKPINLIRNTLNEVTTSPEIKNTLLNNSIGLAAGYLSKLLIVGASVSPIKRTVGTLLQFAVTNLMSRHSESIIASGEKLISSISKRWSKKPMVLSNKIRSSDSSGYEL